MIYEYVYQMEFKARCEAASIKDAEAIARKNKPPAAKLMSVIQVDPPLPPEEPSKGPPLGSPPTSPPSGVPTARVPVLIDCIAEAA